MYNFSFQGAQNEMDRSAHLRRDAGAIAAMWQTAQVMVLWRGKVGIGPQDAGIIWVAPSHPVLGATAMQIFLGIHGGRALFAADISTWQPESGPVGEAGFFDANLQPHPDLPAGAGFADLRGAMTQLSPLDADCAATAKALMSWHDSHGFCAKCGAPSVVQDAGWQRTCPACQTTHFPRTDPVVIMLVTHNDRLLLGRSPQWPEGMYSLLAGFIEPGETFEAAVRREVIEETGVRVGDVRYLASQPWPFPASLMLGAMATATSDAITVDPAELEDALWLTRQQVLEVQLGRNPKVKAGRKGAIAQGLIEAWLSGRID